MKVPKIVWTESSQESKPINKTYLGMGACGLAIITFLFPIIMAAVLFMLGVALIILNEKDKEKPKVSENLPIEPKKEKKEVNLLE